MTVNTLYNQLVAYTKKQGLVAQYPANNQFIGLLDQYCSQSTNPLIEEAHIAIKQLAVFERDALCPIYLAQLIKYLNSYSWFLTILEPANESTKRAVIKNLQAANCLSLYIDKLEAIQQCSPVEADLKRIIFEEVNHFFGWYFSENNQTDSNPQLTTTNTLPKQNVSLLGALWPLRACSRTPNFFARLHLQPQQSEIPATSLSPRLTFNTSEVD